MSISQSERAVQLAGQFVSTYVQDNNVRAHVVEDCKEVIDGQNYGKFSRWYQDFGSDVFFEYDGNGRITIRTKKCITTIPIN